MPTGVYTRPTIRPVCHPERSHHARGICKRCYEQRNPLRRVQYRKWWLRKAYGITLEQYAQLLRRQGGVCAICLRPPKSESLGVDHDHKTGRIRGLLCRLCNYQLLGRLTRQYGGDSLIFQRAAKYLGGKYNTHYYVPKVKGREKEAKK